MAVSVLTGGHQLAVDRELVASGIDVETARARGDYVTVDSEQLADHLVVHGEVDVERFEAVTSGMFQTAADRGGETRICGDLASTLWRAHEIEAVLTLESLWNQIVDAPPFRLLCLYSTAVLRDAPMEAFAAACSLHTEVTPVESYERLVDPDLRRALLLLDVQQRSHQQVRDTLVQRGWELESALDRAVRAGEEQQEQFRRALASRDVIGQAKGIIMVRWRVDADAAFAMLRDASSRSHRKLHVVARALVDQQLRRN